jgi:ethanolamine ammonia-lyase large subunit
MTPQELRRTFVLANEFKEGDRLVGGTDDPAMRTEARRSIAALHVREIGSTAFVEDGVSEAIDRSLDSAALADLAGLTIADLKRILLSPACPDWIARHRDGLRSETIAAVVKLMTDAELSAVARAVFNPLPGQGIVVGSPMHFGSRIQPNSPGDDEEEILCSIFEGLAYGCGDVIIGLNPASDDVETIVRLEALLRQVVDRLRLPTRYCVLSDIVKQTRARERGPVDVGFQSLAGSSLALRGMVGLDVEGVLDLARGFSGCYFETGQGSEVTNRAAAGVDMVTLEARAYGVARYLGRRTGAWTIVNDVAGFIGPEVFRTTAQLVRVCLEDAVMAKLHGLTMGLDVCAAFHIGIEPAALEDATRAIVELAAPAYLMAVAGNADPMLGYLTTSFREHPRLRVRSGRRMTSAMQQRLEALGVVGPEGEIPRFASGAATGAASLYAVYMQEGGDRRTHAALRAEGTSKLARVRERGYDLGYGHGPGYTAPPAAAARLATIYAHARRALYAELDAGVLRDASPHSLRVRTRACDRDEYLARPECGEAIRDEDTPDLLAVRGSAAGGVQIVISDGLNANAVNEHLRAVLPPLRRELATAGARVSDVDVVIQNGRVRAGYHVGALLGAAVVVHLIGERPGTGLDTLSAYLTYGRDRAGQSRWSRDVDHAATTAVCGIHPNGKPPGAAAHEIARTVVRILEQRCSGVLLEAF